jgi:RNA polymerase sigma-70 factor (ECF subfamily)
MLNRRTALEQKEAAGALSWMTVGDRENPIDNLEHEELKEVLRKALLALPDHHRNVIVMRDIEEMEYQDIAETLGCTIGGAKLRVLRARRALRDRVAPLLTEDNPQ